MPLNHYVTLGRSGLRESPLCLGTMTFGEDWGWGASVEESVRMLNRYIDLGGNFIDTANVYTFGHSEAIIGDLVAAGKVRHIGFSDTPAWKTSQAQMTASFRGWTPLIALQIEYSLLERTVEGELIPMALELGLGITPWSPLKSGTLSGKYRRTNHGRVKPNRGNWVEASLNDHEYTIIETLVQIAEEAQTTPARAALKWLHSQPGVTAPIIGACTLAQLEDNLASLDVTLSAEHLRRLSEVSEPQLNFPSAFLKRSGTFRNPGMVINGEAAADNPMAAPGKRKTY